MKRVPSSSGLMPPVFGKTPFFPFDSAFDLVYAVPDTWGVAFPSEEPSAQHLALLPPSEATEPATRVNDANGITANGLTDRYVWAGDTAIGTTVQHGAQYVFGTASGTVVDAGYQIIELGGKASGTVLNGGDQYVFGTAIGTTVNKNSLQIIEAGGAASDTTLNGGSEIVAAGATVSGTITFVGSGQLTLDQSANLNNLQIAGFNAPTDKLDLAGIAFGPQTALTFVEASSGTSGTLTVSDGVHTDNITLLGQHTAANFTTAPDGHGGTIVTDPPVLPAGVTLQQIDGGSSYYSSHGFTYAAAAGWDSPNFFPIGPWLAPLLDQSDANRWLDLGLNTAFGFTSNSPLSLMLSNGISAIVANQELSLNLSSNGGSLGPEIVGQLTYDEPTNFGEGISTPLSTTPNSVQDGRFWWTNFTDAFLYYGALNGTPSPDTAAADLFTAITTPDGTQRHIDELSVDIYWFAGAKGDVSTVLGPGGQYDNLPGPMTPDQAARGSNYGDMIDRERAITGGTIPLFAYVEDGGPYLEDTSASDYITPPELNWAVWSSLIHGARGVIYFNHTFAGPAGSGDNLAQPFYQTIQPGQTISIYDQVQQTDALIKQLAPVLNSPFALNYVTVNSGGYTFPIADTTLGGIEAMAKDYNGQFYIFTDTRDSETQTNIHATFTIADPNATSVTVINENRTIPVVNGVFSDTFAYAWTVHIYEVNDGSSQVSGAPAAPAITTFSPDTGSIADVTDANVLTLSGTAAASSTVNLYDGTVLLGTATADASGAWNFKTATLTDGVHSFTATDTLAGATSSASAALAVTVDTVAPAAPIITSDVTHSDNSVSISGTALDHGVAELGDLIKIYDGSTLIGTTTTDASGAWGYTTNPLSTGLHALTATVTDVAGNTSAPSQVVDPPVAPAAPAITSFSPATGSVGGVTDANVLTLTGTAEANTTVSVDDGSTLLGTATANASGAWSYVTPKLADGTHVFTAIDTDASGLTSAPSPTLNVTVDTAVPTDTFTGAVKNSNGSFTLTGTALDKGLPESGDVIKIYDNTSYIGSTTVGSNGSWSFTTPALVDSVHTFTSTVTDQAGNIGQSSSSVTFNTSTKHIYVSTTGNDVMTGAGGSDTFVFLGTNFGKDVITNFHPQGGNQDVIQFNQTAFSNFAAVLSHAQQVGSDVVITHDPADTVTLKNVVLNKLTQSNFLFV